MVAMLQWNWIQFVLLLNLIYQSYQTPVNQPLRFLHCWKSANLEYPSFDEKQKALQSGQFIPAHVAILDADYFVDPRTSKKRLFVTSPQFMTGTPVTLSEIKDYKIDDPLMSPFPSWDDQNQTTCSGPVSVYRIQIDKCGLMWVADSGLVDSFGIPKQVCRPKLLVYDLNRGDELIDRYGFPDGVISDNSALNTIVVESFRDDCRDSVAYIADVNGRALVAYNFSSKISWRVDNPYFHPFPDQAYQTINGVTFELMDGLFGLALSPPRDGSSTLYFHSLASVRESWVSTSALKNFTLMNDPLLRPQQFHHSVDIRAGQSTVQVMTKDGILIYTVLPKTALACWNTAHPAKKEFQHIIYQDAENLQFISGLKLINQKLLITSCKLQNYMMQLNTGSDVKYRVMVIDDIDRLLDGTPCRSVSSRFRS